MSNDQIPASDPKFDELMTEHYQLLERYKAGDHSAELLDRFFQVNLEITLRGCVDYDEKTSAVICQMLREYVEMRRKYDFSQMTVKDLLSTCKNLGASQSEMKGAIISELTKRLDGNLGNFDAETLLEINGAFEEYHKQHVKETPIPKQLYNLQAKLDGYQIYSKGEVAEFVEIFYRRKQPNDLADMNACLHPAVTRFRGFNEDEREEIRNTFIAYRDLCSSCNLFSATKFQDSDLGKLYSFARFLLFKLPKD